jgi:hypothetical protein
VQTVSIENAVRQASSAVPATKVGILCREAKRITGFRPPTYRNMASTRGNCRLVPVHEAGHLMNIEQPALYTGCFAPLLGGIRQ